MSSSRAASQGEGLDKQVPTYSSLRDTACTTIKEGAFFGIYADRETLPDAELLAKAIDESIEELIAHAR
jgi:hypothetical protein